MTAINRHNNSKEAKRHMNAVAGLGCAMCHHLHGPHDPGPVELHHLRGNGWGRGDYKTVMGLCFNHHRGPEGIHHIGTRLWERDFGITQRELLAWALAQPGVIVKDEKQPLANAKRAQTAIEVIA